MVDTTVLIGVTTAVVTLIGIGAGFWWNARIRKDKIEETRATLMDKVEQTAKSKYREETLLAKELAIENKKIATDVKQDMKDHIDRLIITMKADLELARVMAYSKMGEIDSRVAQIKIDLIHHIEEEKDEHVRMQKSIDFFQTMQFGPDAKSIPDYITGEEETQEHKDEPYKGVFASRKDTTGKDTKDQQSKEEQDKEEQ